MRVENMKNWLAMLYTVGYVIFGIVLILLVSHNKIPEEGITFLRDVFRDMTVPESLIIAFYYAPRINKT